MSCLIGTQQSAQLQSFNSALIWRMKFRCFREAGTEHVFAKFDTVYGKMLPVSCTDLVGNFLRKARLTRHHYTFAMRFFSVPYPITFPKMMSCIYFQLEWAGLKLEVGDVIRSLGYGTIVAAGAKTGKTVGQKAWHGSHRRGTSPNFLQKQVKLVILNRKSRIGPMCWRHLRS